MAIIVSFVWMIIWLFELILSSFIISIGAEKLSHYLSGRFVGRTILSITTTLPEILIVIYASRMELYGVSLGSALGSNILMMSLGLALMTLIVSLPSLAITHPLPYFL
jgi:cation:H+ antiporter